MATKDLTEVPPRDTSSLALGEADNLAEAVIRAAYAMDLAAEGLFAPFARETRYSPEIVAYFWGDVLQDQAKDLREHWEKFDAERDDPRMDRPWKTDAIIDDPDPTST